MHELRSRGPGMNLLPLQGSFPPLVLSQTLYILKLRPRPLKGLGTSQAAMADVRLLVVATGLVALCGGVARLINTVQPQPYMDEVFHIPQVQQYGRHNFSYWDPMITTLPGLYFSSLLWIEPLSWLLQIEPISLCTTAVLRLQNVFFTILNLFVLYWLLRKLHKRTTTSTDLLLSALNLTTFPVLFFFTFLYYTDVGTTFFTLLAYALSLKDQHISSATVLLLSVCFRQTSIVWVVFVAGTAGLRVIKTQFCTERKGRPYLFASLLGSLFTNLPTLLLLLWPYAAVIAFFFIFVACNGSIVVGDKSHHQAGLHLPQVLYCAVFACFFGSGQLVVNWRVAVGFIKAMRKPVWIAGLILLMVFGLFAVHHYTYAHPYLLADNRHYPFYVWKNVFKRHDDVKYYFIPVYSVAILFIIFVLSKCQSELWILLYCVCCMVTLVPQKLLEFRYFILPYLLLRLHMPQGPRLSLVAELLLYSAVNGLTIWLFLYRPFHWPDSQNQQRFMW